MEMYSLLVGASKEGELHLVMDANVSNPIQPFIFHSYFLFLSRQYLGDTTLVW